MPFYPNHAHVVDTFVLPYFITVRKCLLIIHLNSIIVYICKEL